MGKPAPRKMSRWSEAVVGRSVVYFNVGSRRMMYAYNFFRDVWTTLLDCPYRFSSFVMVDNQLIAVGGLNFISVEHKNNLHSLKEELQPARWVEEFPPMPTKRASASSVCTSTHLIIAGGSYDGPLSVVEVLNTQTRQWSIAASLPKGVKCATGVVCKDCLYIVDGYTSNSFFYVH